MASAASAASAIGLRLISLYFGWHTPRAYVWRNPFSGMRQQDVPADHTRLDMPRYPAPDIDPTVAFDRPVFTARPPGGR